MASPSALLHDVHVSLADSGETDRQMVLLHVDNALLAMRTSHRHSHRGGAPDDRDGSEYAAAQGLLELQRRLFAGAVPVPGHVSLSSPVGPAPALKTPAVTASPTAGALPRLMAANLQCPDAEHFAVSEATILRAFANVCSSPNTSAVVTGVALAALVDMLDLPCSFVTTEGVYAAIEAASDTRAEVPDNTSHEALLSRIFGVYVAALNHPAAAMAHGSVHVRALGRMMIMATHSDASQLLKRTVEKNMRLIVMTLFRRLLHLPASAEGGEAAAAAAAVVAAGTVVLHFISRLISGDIASFDADGCEVAATVASGNGGGGGGGGGDGASASGGASAGGGDTSPSSEKKMALMQLEGLSLAQDCLLLLRSSLGKPVCAPLLDAVQNHLCRALLIAGIGTTRSIVLSQVLRTVHLATQGSSEHLIPQIYNFIRVLHLGPLETLTNELTDIGAGVLGSPVGRAASPYPASGSPASPVSAASSSGGGGGGHFGRLSPQLLQQKQERRDILLDSLAEFCSDPRFSSFCFIHYDLSWRYASLLPQLCQVLANHAYPVFRSEAEASAATAAWAHRRGGIAGERDAAAQRRQRAAAVDHRRDRRQRSSTAAGRLLRSTQRTALDATTNMVSGITRRAIAAGAPSPSSFSAALHGRTQQALREKDALHQFAALFEESPMKKGIPFLLEHAIRVPRGTEEEGSLQHRTRLVVAEPAGGRELGETLYRLSIVLNKRVLGDYIGEQGRNKLEDSADAVDVVKPAALFSVRFFEEQLVGFIHQFQFHNKPLLEAIREMVYLLCLPGESQKIDRVMEVFAKHWYQQNLSCDDDGAHVKDESINPFHSDSGAFVLSFAIIMLNTDQHSGKVAQQMKKEDFVKMNRGIDDGKDVPAAYLGCVYDDVRQHEVVMADMMDRGFANDTTWRLEMRPCASFAQQVLGTAAAPAAEAQAVESLANMSARESAATAAGAAVAVIASPASRAGAAMSTVLHTFDPFLFQCLWKRSLLVFGGMLESSVEEVSLTIVATGATVAHAVEEAQRQLPAEMTILQSSLRGVCMLARAAHALGLPAVADQCFMVLLQFVVMGDLTNAEEEVRSLYRSVPKLLCMREAFALLADIHGSLGDSWLPLSRLFLDLQLMGMFALPTHETPRGKLKKGGAAGPEKAEKAEKVAEPLRVLAQDPGICANVFAPLSAAAAAVAAAAGGGVDPLQKTAGERGWFSSLFGSNEAPQVSAVQLLELRDAQGRLSSCIPGMQQLLNILKGVTADPRAGCQCVHNLCIASSIDEDATAAVTGEREGGRGNGHSSSSLGEASAYAASFELALVCAVVGGATSSAVLRPEPLAQLTGRISRLLREVDTYLCDARASENVRVYWCSLGHRVVSAALQLMAAHWRGSDGAIGMGQLWACWVRAAPSVFGAVVAAPVAAFLFDHVVGTGDTENGVDQAATTAATAAGPAASPPPWGSGREVLALLAPFATHAAAVTDAAVQRQVGTILLRVVQQRRCSALDDTESVVSLCLAFSEWLRPGHSSGSSTAVGDTVEGSATARAKSKAGAGGAAGAAAALPSGASVAEILSLCGRNVLLERTDTAADGAEDAAAEAWYGLWVLVLRSLGALALCSTEARDGSESILCLQRALLDSEAHSLPSSAVVAVYKDILIPLTQRLCVPKARVHTSLRWSGAGAAEMGEAGGSGAGVDRTSSGVLGRLFNSLLAPATGEWNGRAGSASPPAAGSASTARRLDGLPLVSTEVKCRLLSLVPKMLLRYTAALAADTEVLVSLWRQVLGTLYAVYSAYPDATGGGGGGGGGGHDVSHDEAMLVQEAVEETVKNMIYVVATTWHESSPASSGAEEGEQQEEHTVVFWSAIVHLIHPFPFSPPLLEFMAHAGLVREEAPDATVSP